MKFTPSDIPVVILCGGEGTRFREETHNKPKPMIEIGNYPIIWHVMQLYASYGFNKFILCLGYKGKIIKDYFLNIKDNLCDLKLNLSTGEKTFLNEVNSSFEDIIFAETGTKTQTGGRIKMTEKYIDSDYFMVTYGDGLADINIHDLMQFHLDQGRIGTVTGVNSVSQFGELTFDGSEITNFVEKPEVTSVINGGFFVFHKSFFKYLEASEDCVLEKEPMAKLVSDRQLSLYRHKNFWQCMDNYKDYLLLNELWSNRKAPWKVMNI